MTGPAPDLGDVQGLLRRGYGTMPHASFLLLRVTDPAAARRWLGDLCADITTAGEELGGDATNVAFTYAGLEALGLERDALHGLPRELQEGMTTSHRQRILGDFGSSHPDLWEWGGPRNEPVHCVLLVYATTGEGLVATCDAHRAAFAAGGAEITTLGTVRLPRRNEHFGFRDGIAQPEIEGFWGDAKGGNVLAAGEFLLGYANQSGRFPDGPGAFGENGSYLVFRQLEQHVRDFWEFVDGATRDPDGSANATARTLLASKMVGRWPSGAPLVNHPQSDPDAGKPEEDLPSDEESDDFLFHALDAAGDRCPLGSHVRRSNPRDALDPSPESSLRNSSLHRVLRRGRAYGDPIASSMDPADVLRSTTEDGGRGLHFLCFNTDIAQQFEFIQQNWINSPKFESMFYAAADPITGAHDPERPEFTGTFTVQAEPVRRRVTGVRRFVDVRGGAYFFMPGLRGISHLARIS